MNPSRGLAFRVQYFRLGVIMPLTGHFFTATPERHALFELEATSKRTNPDFSASTLGYPNGMESIPRLGGGVKKIIIGIAKIPCDLLKVNRFGLIKQSCRCPPTRDYR
jgi:hypothetical protein